MNIKITARSINIYGIVSIIVMSIMLALLWFKVVPEAYTVPFFASAMALFVVRVVLRIKLARMERKVLHAKKDKH